MFAKSVIALTLTATTALAQLMVNSPASLIQCQPVLLSWSGGTGPYFLAAIPGGQSSAAAIKDFGKQDGTSLTWTVDIAAGKSVSLKITDSAGQVNYNQAVDIQAGSSDSCLNASGNSTNVSTGGSGSSVSSSAPASGTGTAVAANTQNPAGSSMNNAASSPAPSSAKPSGTSGTTPAAAASSSGAALPMAAIDLKSGVVAMMLGVAGITWL